jgi:hypothetical protein
MSAGLQPAAFLAVGIRNATNGKGHWQQLAALAEWLKEQNRAAKHISVPRITSGIGR